MNGQLNQLKETLNSFGDELTEIKKKQKIIIEKKSNENIATTSNAIGLSEKLDKDTAAADSCKDPNSLDSKFSEDLSQKTKSQKTKSEDQIPNSQKTYLYQMNVFNTSLKTLNLIVTLMYVNLALKM